MGITAGICTGDRGMAEIHLVVLCHRCHRPIDGETLAYFLRFRRQPNYCARCLTDILDELDEILNEANEQISETEERKID